MFLHGVYMKRASVIRLIQGRYERYECCDSAWRKLARQPRGTQLEVWIQAPSIQARSFQTFAGFIQFSARICESVQRFSAAITILIIIDCLENYCWRCIHRSCFNITSLVRSVLLHRGSESISLDKEALVWL